MLSRFGHLRLPCCGEALQVRSGARPAPCLSHPSWLIYTLTGLGLLMAQRLAFQDAAASSTLVRCLNSYFWYFILQKIFSCLCCVITLEIIMVLWFAFPHIFVPLFRSKFLEPANYTGFVLTVIHFSMNNNSIKIRPSCSVVRNACVFRYQLLNDTINICDSWLITLSCASAGSDWISRTRRVRLLVGPLSLCLHYPEVFCFCSWGCCSFVVLPYNIYWASYVRSI